MKILHKKNFGRQSNNKNCTKDNENIEINSNLLLKREYRSIKKKMDIKWYKKEYPTYIEYNSDPVLHYYFVGKKNNYYLTEKEKLENEFDVEWFENQFPITKLIDISSLDYYKKYGKLENLPVNAEENIIKNLYKKENFTEEKVKDIEYINIFCNIFKLDTIKYDDKLVFNKKLTEQKLCLLVYASSSCFSEKILDSLLKMNKCFPVRIICLANVSIKKNEKIFKKIEILSEKVEFIFTKRSTPLCSILKSVLNSICCEYILFLTMNSDFTADIFFENILISLTNANKKFYILNRTYKDVKNILLQDQSISAINGIIFKKEYLSSELLKIEDAFDFYLPQFLINHKNNSEYEELFLPNIGLHIQAFDKFTIEDLSYYIKNSIDLLSKDIKNVDVVVSVLRYIVKMYSLIQIFYYILASGLAILCSYIYSKGNFDLFRKITKELSCVIDSESILDNNYAHKVNKVILERLIKVDKNTIAIFETDYMNDLKEYFVLKAKKYFNIIYLSRPQFCSYIYFFSMCTRAIVQPCNLIIASNNIDIYASDGKSVVMAWHGLGLLKKIKNFNYNFFPKDILLTSSEYCIDKWSDIFSISSNRIFPLGNLSSDILFDEYYLNKFDVDIRKEYNIPIKSEIIFYAPTFRDYNDSDIALNFDIESLSHELELCNIYLIIKKHHIVKENKERFHLSLVNANISNKKFVIFDDKFNFVDLLSVCNFFMTDYSSGLFYALIRNLPIILYAYDLKVYKSKYGDFLINYPDDIPGTFVSNFANQKLINVLNESRKLVNTMRYKDFKNKMVSSCNGFCSDKLINLLKRFL